VPVDPAKIGLGLVSPRKRAQQTFDIIFAGVDNKPAKTTTEEVREWDYGTNVRASLVDDNGSKAVS
jgi:probable phosphoglycerate mutase